MGCSSGKEASSGKAAPGRHQSAGKSVEVEGNTGGGGAGGGQQQQQQQQQQSQQGRQNPSSPASTSNARKGGGSVSKSASKDSRVQSGGRGAAGGGGGGPGSPAAPTHNIPRTANRYSREDSSYPAVVIPKAEGVPPPNADVRPAGLDCPPTREWDEESY